MILDYSSCLYATIVVHAFYVRRYVLGLMWLIHNQVSIINYAHNGDPSLYNGGYFIYMIEHAGCVTNWLYVMYRSCLYLHLNNPITWVITLFLAYTYTMYNSYEHVGNVYEYSRNHYIVIYIHNKIHIAATIGMHIFLMVDNMNYFLEINKQPIL